MAALDRGRSGESYVLAGDAAADGRIGGDRGPGRRPQGAAHVDLHGVCCGLIAPINDRLGGLPGMPANMRETIRAGGRRDVLGEPRQGAAELGFGPRSLEQGVADTWGSAADQREVAQKTRTEDNGDQPG